MLDWQVGDNVVAISLTVHGGQPDKDNILGNLQLDKIYTIESIFSTVARSTKDVTEFKPAVAITLKECKSNECNGAYTYTRFRKIYRPKPKAFEYLLDITPEIKKELLELV